MELSLHVLHPVYASIYLPAWYRMLGVKVGPRAEISTAALDHATTFSTSARNRSSPMRRWWAMPVCGTAG